MHDLISLAPIILADGPSSATIKAALISGAALVVSAALAALAAMRNRDAPSDPMATVAEAAWANFNAELSRRAVAAEHTVVELRAENERLRDMCWALGHDPDESAEGVAGNAAST